MKITNKNLALNLHAYAMHLKYDSVLPWRYTFFPCLSLETEHDNPGSCSSKHSTPEFLCCKEAGPAMLSSSLLLHLRCVSLTEHMVFLSGGQDKGKKQTMGILQ